MKPRTKAPVGPKAPVVLLLEDNAIQRLMIQKAAKSLNIQSIGELIGPKEAKERVKIAPTVEWVLKYCQEWKPGNDTIQIAVLDNQLDDQQGKIQGAFLMLLLTRTEEELAQELKNETPQLIPADILKYLETQRLNYKAIITNIQLMKAQRREQGLKPIIVIPYSDLKSMTPDAEKAYETAKARLTLLRSAKNLKSLIEVIKTELPLTVRTKTAPKTLSAASSVDFVSLTSPTTTDLVTPLTSTPLFSPDSSNRDIPATPVETPTTPSPFSGSSSFGSSQSALQMLSLWKTDSTDSSSLSSSTPVISPSKAFSPTQG
jgi:hypothetical protein